MRYFSQNSQPNLYSSASYNENTSTQGCCHISDKNILSTCLAYCVQISRMVFLVQLVSWGLEPNEISPSIRLVFSCDLNPFNYILVTNAQYLNWGKNNVIPSIHYLTYRSRWIRSISLQLTSFVLLNTLPLAKFININNFLLCQLFHAG